MQKEQSDVAISNGGGGCVAGDACGILRCAGCRAANHRERSVGEFADRELEDQQRRYDAGTVPRFNVLQAEVAVANARPPLINARNQYRIAKNNLSNLLGYNLPRNVWEDIPLNLTDKLDANPYDVELPDGDCTGVGTTDGIGRRCSERKVCSGKM